jgi:two-component system phosphate regulon sensor histidine kinase PhoR
MKKLRNSEYRAILAAMDEGMLVFDRVGNLLEVNPTAVRLLNLSESSLGADIDSIFSNEKLNTFIHKALRLTAHLQDFITLRGDDQEVHLKLYARPLLDTTEGELGTLVVVSDITRLRHLESVRRDFVANVSHELKTPVTSIKGFVETLLEGAMENPQDAKRFLQIVARQADRLDNIFNDLLTLAKLEQQEEEHLIELKEGKLKEVLFCALQDCEREAQDKKIEISISCDEEIFVSMNSPLLEQAVANLISNAIKYSEPQKHIHVWTEESSGEIKITVQDQGCGIAEHHLPRIWERFYRADQARSRKSGGTGLGLSIVKHIAQVHSGYLSVESTVGLGSHFTIHLPRQQIAQQAV